MSRDLNENQSYAWVMSTKRPGDRVGKWAVDQLFEETIRLVTESERCKVTSYCYPTGAKLIQAKVHRCQ